VLTGTPADITWRVRTPGGVEALVSPRPVLRLSSLLMVRDAVLAGAGAALLPKLLVSEDLEAQRLVLLGTQAGEPVGIWALHSSRRLVSAKVRAFLEVMERELSLRDGSFARTNGLRPTRT
jgi:DNA-binding transcriptional LysR family regulator